MAVPEQLLPHLRHGAAVGRGEPVDRLPLRRPRRRWAAPWGSCSRARSPTSPRCTAASCYPEGPADNNGADIFRAAVGYRTTPPTGGWTGTRSPNADVPIAEWTFSTEGSTPAAGETWPANAGLRSAGIQYALVVSAQHARLLEVASGAPVAGAELHTEVNLAAHSFVVRIPTSVLPVSGQLAGASRGRPGQRRRAPNSKPSRPRTEACPAGPTSTTSPSAATSRRASWCARPNSCPCRGSPRC